MKNVTLYSAKAGGGTGYPHNVRPYADSPP